MEKKWFQKEKTIGGKEPLINNSPVVKSSPIVKDIPVKKNTQLTKKILIAVVLFISLGLFFLIIASEEGFFENILNKIKEIGGFGGNSSSNDSGSSSSSSSSSSSGGGSSCGDGTCNSNENGISCPSDCVTECNDGSDNDNDGDIDLDDGGCANSNDDTESSGGSSSGGSSGGSSGSGSGGGSSCGDGTCDSDEDGALCPSDCVTECNDGDDDDGDGWIDLVDPGCTDENDDDESNADMGFQCSNNADDDGDGLTDGEDPMCTFWMDDDEFSECNDGVDNDGDGGEDYNLNNLSGDTGCDGYNDDSENSEVKSPLTKFASSSKYNWPLASTLSNNLEVLYRSDGTTLQMLNLSLLNSQTLPPITQIVMKEVDIYSSTMDLKEIGNSLFICSGDFGLHSIDSNLESTPSLIDIHERELWCSSLAVANLGNEELLIALWSGFDDNEVRIYNSTTKNLLGSVLINKANGTDHEGIGWDIEVGDSNAYIALGTSGIIQINWENVINGNSPNLLQGPLAITNPSYDRETKSLLKVRDLSINEGILYAAANAQGLIEINLSDPWSSSMNKKIHLQENFLIDRYPTRVKAITDNNQNTLVAIETVKNPNYGEWGPYVMYGEILWNSLNPFPEGDLDDLDNTNHNFERGSSLGGLVILEKQNNNAQFQEVASGASTATTPGIKTLEFHQIGNDFFAYNERPFIYKFTRNSSNNLQNATISGGDEVLQGHGFYIQGKKSKIKSDVLIATCDGGPHSIQKINSTPPKFSIIPGTYDLKYRFGLWSGARWVTSLGTEFMVEGGAQAFWFIHDLDWSTSIPGITSWTIPVDLNQGTQDGYLSRSYSASTLDEESGLIAMVRSQARVGTLLTNKSLIYDSAQNTASGDSFVPQFLSQEILHEEAPSPKGSFNEILWAYNPKFFRNIEGNKILAVPAAYYSDNTSQDFQRAKVVFYEIPEPFNPATSLNSTAMLGSSGPSSAVDVEIFNFENDQLAIIAGGAGEVSLHNITNLQKVLNGTLQNSELDPISTWFVRGQPLTNRTSLITDSVIRKETINGVQKTRIYVASGSEGVYILEINKDQNNQLELIEIERINTIFQARSISIERVENQDSLIVYDQGGGITSFIQE